MGPSLNPQQKQHDTYMQLHQMILTPFGTSKDTKTVWSLYLYSLHVRSSSQLEGPSEIRRAHIQSTITCAQEEQ